MTFRNPLTSLPADAITSGTFTGTYRNAGTFILAGAAGASRIEASGTELAFYGADGVTKLIDLVTSSGAGSINSATVTGGTVQTAAAGQRWVMAAAAKDTLAGYTGDPSENAPGQLVIGPLGSGKYASGPWATLPSKGLGAMLLAPWENTGLIGDFAPFAAVTSYDPANPGTSQPGLWLHGGKGGPAGVVRVSRIPGAGWSDVWAGDNLIRGNVTGTTDVNGRLTVTHNLGVMPTCVTTSPASADGGTPILGFLLTPKSSWSTTQFIARAVSTTGAAIASTSVTFSFAVS